MLCHFRPLHEISNYVHVVPPLQLLIGTTLLSELDALCRQDEPCACCLPANESKAKILLKKTFAGIVSSPTSQTAAAAEALVSWIEGYVVETRVESGFAVVDLELIHLVTRLHGDYPYDSGLFMPFLLNYVQLKPNEAVYLAPGDIHAYISGGKLLHSVCVHS